MTEREDLERLKAHLKTLPPKDAKRYEAYIGKMPLRALLELVGLEPVTVKKPFIPT